MIGLRFKEAAPGDLAMVSEILREAAHYLEALGQPLWQDSHLTVDALTQELDLAWYFVAYDGMIPVGVLRLQPEDRKVWPEANDGEALYLHRLAIIRAVASSGISTAMLDWAKKRTRDDGRHYLRLDCEPRAKLCALYERNGFVRQGESQVGPYRVARYECEV